MGGSAKWKREIVLEHKFDHVRLADFRTTAFWPKIRYSFIYLMVLRLFFLYFADLITIVFYFRGITSTTFPIDIPVAYLAGIYLFCFVSSNLIFINDARKSKRIVKSRDIAFAFTNTIAYRYYCLKDYLYFCFFDEISKMKSRKDGIALYVFLRLRGWKRLIFAEAPRNIINIYILTRIAISVRSINPARWLSPSLLYNLALIVIMISTAIFIISIVSSFIAICLYFPLICSIKGNLKEYICHKVEKRIAELIANHGMKRRNQRGDSPGPKQAPRGTHIGGSLSKDLEFNDRMQREPPVMEMSQRRNFPSYLHSNPPSLQRNHPQHQNYHQHQQQHFITPQRALTDPFASRETVDRRYQSPQIASHIASQPQENWRHNNIDIQFISPPTSRPASPPIGKKQSTRPSPNNSFINQSNRPRIPPPRKQSSTSSIGSRSTQSDGVQQSKTVPNRQLFNSYDRF